MLQNFFSDIPKDVTARLKEIDLNIQSPQCNHEINNLLQRTVLLGGKRLRPMLTFVTGKCLGVSLDELEPYAAAIEMVHAASLAHDDVIDNAMTRRGRDSINIQASNQKAVLAGDYLLAYVIRSLTQNGNYRLVDEMAQIIGQLAEGEWLQLDLIDSKKYSHEQISKVAHFKTASVMSWCTTAPAILAGLSESNIEKCRKLGENLGLAFQLIDDTFDFSKSSQKDINLDLENGIVNSVTMHWFESNPEAFDKFQLGDFNLNEITDKSLTSSIEAVKRKASQHLGECFQLINSLEKTFIDEELKSTFISNKNSLEFIVRYLEKRII